MLRDAGQPHLFLGVRVLVKSFQVAGSYLIPTYHMIARHFGHNWIGILSSPKAAIWRLVKAYERTGRRVSFPGCWLNKLSRPALRMLNADERPPYEGRAGWCIHGIHPTNWTWERQESLCVWSPGLILPVSRKFNQEAGGVVSGAGEPGFGSWLCSFLPVWSLASPLAFLFLSYLMRKSGWQGLL